jgi:hypothetical protein
VSFGGTRTDPGTAWPYERVETVFMNKTLQKSSQLRLDLALSKKDR